MKEFFSQFGRNVKLVKLILVFLSSAVLVNVVEFRKIVTKVFWKHLVTEFTQKFCKFHVDRIIYFQDVKLRIK